jgi:hypothetical protein
LSVLPSDSAIVRISVVDILSYLRRRKTPADPAPIAEDEAINLETIGGEISNSYVDIASISDPPPKPTTKERPLRQPERSIERQPERQAEPQPELQLDRPPDRQFDLPPRQIRERIQNARLNALLNVPLSAVQTVRRHRNVRHVRQIGLAAAATATVQSPATAKACFRFTASRRASSAAWSSKA